MSGLSGYPRTSPAVKGDSGCLFALGPNSGRHTLAVPRDVGSLAARPRRSGNTMRRREFIAATAALLVSPRRSRAQGARRRLGVLAINEMLPTMQNAWLDGLRNHGWIDGRNLIIEYRYARSQDRLPASAAELVALSPDVLLAPNTQAAVALKSATANIPIVFAPVGDPEGLGPVQSLSRPGGNMTGLSPVVPGFTGKGIEILR